MTKPAPNVVVAITYQALPDQVEAAIQRVRHAQLAIEPRLPRRGDRGAIQFMAGPLVAASPKKAQHVRVLVPVARRQPRGRAAHDVEEHVMHTRLVDQHMRHLRDAVGHVLHPGHAGEPAAAIGGSGTWLAARRVSVCSTP